MVRRWGVTDWPTLRLSLWMRSRGRCEFCGRDLNNSAHVHHRKLRSQGGGDEPENLVIVHPEHHRMAHENPSFAYAHGWMVHSWDDPETVAVVRCRGVHGCTHEG